MWGSRRGTNQRITPCSSIVAVAPRSGQSCRQGSGIRQTHPAFAGRREHILQGKCSYDFDALHLSGGNTFYFLSTIRKRNFINMIRSYVMNNGILIGVSAGSILMTNSIELAGFGDYADQNFVGITDLSSLGLVNFEFLPHWNGSTDGTELLRKYSKMKDTIIYACRDNDGIIVNNDKVKLMGQIEIIQE